MYRLTRKIIIFTVNKFLFHVEYENTENLEKYDKCLICPNHSRVFDPIYLYPQVENMYSVAKSELFKNKLLNHFLTYHNAIPIKRDSKDFAGTKNIINILEEKEKIKLLIFPEGGIYKENYLEGKRRVKSGAVFIAATANVPIIPIYITSRAKFFSKVKVTFGEPFFPKQEVLEDKKVLREEAKRLIDSIYETGKKQDKK